MDEFMQEEQVNENLQPVKKKNINLKQIIIPIISTLVLSFIISFFMLMKPIGSLKGVWVRQPDDNPMANGMVIEIKKAGGVYVGEVIAIDDESGIPIGSIKWTGFQKDALNVFGYYDLSFSTNPADRSYSASYGIISPDGNKLTIYAPFASVGSHQVWIKQ